MLMSPERLDERRLAALFGNQPRRLRDAQKLVDLFAEFRVRIGAVREQQFGEFRLR
jgi:hypothetical protein